VGAGEHGRLDEVALVAEALAAGQRGGAVLLARLQVAGDPAELLVGDWMREFIGILRAKPPA
jgi:hypothetical protein